MKIYHSGDLAKRGYYLELKSWKIIPLEDGLLINGPPKQAFLRLSPTEALLLAPLLGAAYVIFLPIVGFVLIGKALWSRMRN